ncbi:MAG: hypothetical protein IT576_21465 [Verrucomicrobiales bacterium]|nr:hypothetical protein [Verrucomicrobiales bacterium]
MNLNAFLESVRADPAPLEEMTGEMKALWLCRNSRWHEAHEIAQDIETPLGSRIHALLHLMEGDIGNAGYWYAKAGSPVRGLQDIDSEWDDLARTVCA